MADPASVPRPRRRGWRPLPVATPAVAGGFGGSVGTFLAGVYVAAGGWPLDEKAGLAWVGICTFIAVALLGGRRDRTNELQAAAQAHRQALEQAAHLALVSDAGSREHMADQIRALPPPMLTHEP